MTTLKEYTDRNLYVIEELEAERASIQNKIEELEELDKQLEDEITLHQDKIDELTNNAIDEYEERQR